MKQIIDNAKEKCLNGKILTRDEIIELLNIPISSDDDIYLRKTARDVAAIITKNKGFIWSAVGIDYAPCKMNCKFCSFGEKWGIIQNSKEFSQEEILEHVKSYVSNGANYIVLRTTEFFNIEKLLEYVKNIRKNIAGDYKIVLNTGIFDSDFAKRAYEAGVYGIYQACRIREGIDTKFSPQKRLETMKNISNSNLKLISLTEPIGEEHSNEEIAEAFLNTVNCSATIGGVMARIPVKGTPFENIPVLNEEKSAHIVAALRLSGGNVIKDICAHPATLSVMTSGANVLVVEAGAIPRDTDFTIKDWRNKTMQNAKELLILAGYEL